MKLAAGIFGGVLVKDYGVYKKWTNEWMIAVQVGTKNNLPVAPLEQRNFIAS